MSVQFVIAGTGPVDNKNERKIVNFNLSHIVYFSFKILINKYFKVKGHMDYSKVDYLVINYFILFFRQKLTRVLESVGARVAPLSKESRQDLERFEELQRKLQNGAKLTSSLSVPNLSTLDEEKSSIILEQSKELISKEDEDYEGEDVGLRLRGDPLGVSELRIKRTHSLASAETFHSAMSTLN